MSTNNAEFLLSKDASHALVAYLVDRYTQETTTPLGKAILHKLCYFAESIRVPLLLTFEIYHYGPFSQELCEIVENLSVDDVIIDWSMDTTSSNFQRGPNLEDLLADHADELKRYKGALDNVAKTLSRLTATEMELASTVSYVHKSSYLWNKRPPSRRKVVASVYEIKKTKLNKNMVARVYDVLKNAGLLGFAK